MPANFSLILDTTGPGGVTLAIDGGAAFSLDSDVILNVGTTDPDTTGYQMKVWGDIQGGSADEAGAVWVNFNPALPVTLTAGDGAKTVTVRLRDDVWNESGTATDAITVDTTAPTVNVVRDVGKISLVAGKEVSHLTITPDSNIQAWKVKVVPGSGATENQGTTIPTAGGSVNMTGGASGAGVVIDAEIHGADLQAVGVEGDNTVKVFVQDAAGNWSVV